MTAKLVLGLDTTDIHGSACIADETQVLKAIGWTSNPGHTKHLRKSCDSLLQYAGHRLAGIAVASGPGGFSSVRSGLAFAKGLCLGRGIRLVTVDSLTALVESALPLSMSRVMAVSHARQSEYFCREFSVHRTTSTPLAQTTVMSVSDIVAIEEVDAILVRHFEYSQRARLMNVAQDRKLSIVTPTARTVSEAVAMLGWAKLGKTSEGDVHTAVPTYVRPPETTAPKHGWAKI